MRAMSTGAVNAAVTLHREPGETVPIQIVIPEDVIFAESTLIAYPPLGRLPNATKISISLLKSTAGGVLTDAFGGRSEPHALNQAFWSRITRRSD